MDRHEAWTSRVSRTPLWLTSGILWRTMVLWNALGTHVSGEDFSRMLQGRTQRIPMYAFAIRCEKHFRAFVTARLSSQP